MSAAQQMWLILRENIIQERLPKWTNSKKKSWNALKTKGRGQTPFIHFTGNISTSLDVFLWELRAFPLNYCTLEVFLGLFLCLRYIQTHNSCELIWRFDSAHRTQHLPHQQWVAPAAPPPGSLGTSTIWTWTSSLVLSVHTERCVSVSVWPPAFISVTLLSVYDLQYFLFFL